MPRLSFTRHGRRVRVNVKHTTAGSLTMPTEFTAQNGMVHRQATPIAVTGCPRAKKAKKSRRASHRGHPRR